MNKEHPDYEKYHLMRCLPDDKRRCQHGNCPYISMNDDASSTTSQYCRAHIHHYNKIYCKEAEGRRYKLSTVYADTMNNMLIDREFKSLKEETALLRVALQAVASQLDTANDFIIYQPRIESLVEKISKLVVTQHKMEQALGQVMDKQTLSVLVDDIIKILSEEITDTDSLKRVSVRVGDALEQCNKRALDAATERLESGGN